MKQTLYFQNCLGVFQGGGCRASAYVGAYKKAIEWGVSFSELVGTSAGAIIAVFIAAGATPKELEEFVEELDFNKFLSPPEKIPNIKSKCEYKYLVKFLPKTIKEHYPIYSSLGLYNSKNIKNWVDEKLQIILNKNSTVKFKDLPLDVHVIVSDLKTKKVEIFNKENSANKDVAEAVQYSCNIPIFFQPVELRYVDGGMLSNLGTFIFSNKKEKFYNKILAFSLESDYQHRENEINSIVDYGHSLVNTIIDGNLDIQLNLQSEIHIIRINTNKIRATDFNKITPEVIKQLKLNGEKAVDNFLLNEVANIKNSRNDPNVLIDSFQTLNRITQLTEKQYHEIIIINNDNKFVYEIFPTLTRWINEGSNIIYLYSNCESKDKEHFNFRNRYLEYSGVHVKKIDTIPFTGYLLDADLKENCRAILLNDNDHFHSKYYDGEVDYTVISLMRDSLKQYIPSKIKQKLIVEKIEEEKLISELRKVSQYKPISVKLAIESIKINELIFLTQYVRGYKYRQIAYLYELYRDFNIPLFESAKLSLRDERYTLVTPPVIEMIGDKHYVIEGNTRLLYAYKNGIKELNCVVVKGVTQPLPSEGRFKIKEVILSDKEVIGEERYNKFDYSNFRKIENSVRDPKTCLL